MGNSWLNKAGGPLYDPIRNKVFGSKTHASPLDGAPTPVPAPPVTSTSAEVLAAEHDIGMQNMMKKSVKKSIFAGDTGGWTSGGGNKSMFAGASPQGAAKGGGL